jgi:hypothetical protein
MSGKKRQDLDRIRGSDVDRGAPGKDSYLITEDMTDEELFWRDWTRYQSRVHWRAILREADEGFHVSRDVLLGLAGKWGVPAFAGPYLSGRLSGEIAPPGRPASPPIDPKYPGWANEHHRPKFEAVGHVLRRYNVYKEFETSTPPRPANAPRMKHDAAREIWTIRAPKREARERVARRLDLSAATLKAWEHEMRSWARRVLPKDQYEAIYSADR